MHTPGSRQPSIGLPSLGQLSSTRAIAAWIIIIGDCECGIFSTLSF